MEKRKEEQLQAREAATLNNSPTPSVLVAVVSLHGTPPSVEGSFGTQFLFSSPFFLFSLMLVNTEERLGKFELATASFYKVFISLKCRITDSGYVMTRQR